MLIQLMKILNSVHLFYTVKKLNTTEKLNLLNKKIIDLNILSKKEEAAPVLNGNSKINFDFLSVRLKQNAEIFLEELKKYEQFHLDGNEVVLNNTKLIGSNVVDLVVDLISDKKNQPCLNFVINL